MTKRHIGDIYPLKKGVGIFEIKIVSKKTSFRMVKKGQNRAKRLRQLKVVGWVDYKCSNVKIVKTFDWSLYGT